MVSKERNIFEKVSCNLCNSDDYSIIYKANYKNETDKNIIKKFRASGDELLVDQLVKCKVCSLIYINPRIRSDLMIKAYSQGSDETFVSQAKSRELTFNNSLNKIEVICKRKGKILDIGTAAGSFLAAAKKRAWKVYGCEPNVWLANWGKKNYGIDVKQGTLFHQEYKKEFFDVVTIWDVIEHTPNPSALLKECNKILKKEGILVVNYPDIGSWIARIMKKKWLFLTSVHLYYFNRKTIEKILEKNGFKIVVISPHIQFLEIGYILSRLGKYNRFFSKISIWFAKSLGIQNRNISYWFGQTFVIARKIR